MTSSTLTPEGKATYTPGPWQLFEGSADWGLGKTHIVAPAGAKDPYGDNTIAEIPSVQPYCTGASRKDMERNRSQLANARLIAAAPALVEALEGIIDALESNNVAAAELIAKHAGRAALALLTPLPSGAKDKT